MGFLLIAILSLSLLTTLFILYFKFIKTPLEIQRHFRQQGISGPNYNPIFGNSHELQRLIMTSSEDKFSSKSESFNHDIVVRKVIPDYYFWSKAYGNQFLYWFGTKPRLAIVDPDMIKEILMNSNGWFPKAQINPLAKSLFGKGLIHLEGEQWAVHRKITSQAFTMERVKELVLELVATAESLLDVLELKMRGENRLELDIYKEFNELSADLISKVAFGSSFKEGKRIFELQDHLFKIAAKAVHSVYFSGFKYLPTKNNRFRWRLAREMEELFVTIIIKNEKTKENPKALLSLLMSPYKTKENVNNRLSFNEILDECKTFYVAGRETTANLLTWLFILLGRNQEWQEKAREEVVRVCGHHELPSADHLANLKLITMILNEALRLYPTAPVSVREASIDVKLGGLHIPAKTQLFLAMAAVHHDPKIWGEDANMFNPLRFTEPIKHLASYFPFNIGPRICVGKQLAIAETKIVLAMLIRKYNFVVSPSYIHAPTQMITYRPQYGAPMIFTRLSR